MVNTSSSTSSSTYSDSYLGNCTILEQVGKGGFGVVYKCLDNETNKIVAIKKKNSLDLEPSNEVSILKLLMDNKLDQFNIVKFYGGFSMKRNLVFENLDISLGQYLIGKDLMHLQDIRTVIQQLAVAFDALKNIGVIHTDVNTNNIMLVDHVRQPFKVKLIDFGMAILRHRDKYRKIDHFNYHMAPEVLLGLPFSEAVDMWSLGGVMAEMVLDIILFPGRNDHEILRYIVDLLGRPPDHVINAGNKSSKYFIRTTSHHWMFKKYGGWRKTDVRDYTFRSLDKMIMIRLEKDRKSETNETRECINLIKAMLTWDAGERISPSEVLAHPFITRSYLNKSPSLNNYNKILASTLTESGPSKTDKPPMNQAAEPGIWNSTTLPPGFIMVKPAPLTSTISGLSQTEKPSMKQAGEPGSNDVTKLSMNKAVEPGILKPTTLPSGIIMVQPAPLTTTISGLSQTEKPSMNQAGEPGSNDVTKLSMNQTGEPGILKPTTLPSGIIMVQPAPLTSTISGLSQTEKPSMNQAGEPGSNDVTKLSMNQAGEPGSNDVTKLSMNQTGEPGIWKPTTLPSGIIVVQPAPLTSTISGLSQTEKLSMNQAGEPGIRKPTTLPSGIIMVQSAPLVNSWMVETDADSNPVPATVLDETNDLDKTDDSKLKKKKRNCAKRFFSWCKRTFCSCCCVSDAEE